MGRKMNKKEFDLLIKHLVGNDKLFGYEPKSNKNKVPVSNKDMYYSYDEFEKFKKGMDPKHRQKYAGGAGGEFIEKYVTRKGDSHIYPPKMASVASSSRFCYLALCNGIDITIGNERIKGNPEFEKECKIGDRFKHHPQLDALIQESNCYFEVKCHEIFDSHKIVMKDDYEKLIKKEFGLDPVITSNTKSGTFELPLEEFGIKEKGSTRFDIKQLLCHLLGVAERKDETDKKLVYLFFRPDPVKSETSSIISATVLENELENAFNELITEIECIFKSNPIKDFCQTKHIKLMAIAEKSDVMEPLTNNNMEVLYK